MQPRHRHAGTCRRRNFVILLVVAVIGCQLSTFGSLPAHADPTPLTLTAPGDQGGAVGDVVHLPLSAAGGTAPYNFVATGLPTGLSIDADTGVVSGTITSPGGFAVEVTVADSAAGSAAQQFSWNVTSQSGALEVLAPGDQSSPAQSTVSLVVHATGGTPDYTWTASGLPAGLEIDSATGEISGSPTAQGTSEVSVTASDADQATATSTFDWEVTAPVEAPSPSYPPNQHAVVGDAASLQLHATGGTAPYSWQVTGLPDGITVNATSGLVSGTATTSGLFPVDVLVSGADGGTADFGFVWTVTEYAWSVSLTASGTTVTASSPVTLTAQLNQDIANTNEAVVIYPVGNFHDYVVATCDSGTTCHAEVPALVAGTHQFVASVVEPWWGPASGDPGDVLASSAPVAVTFPAWTLDISASSTASTVASPATVSAAVNLPIQSPDSHVVLRDTTDDVVIAYCTENTDCSGTARSKHTGPHTYRAELWVTWMGDDEPYLVSDPVTVNVEQATPDPDDPLNYYGLGGTSEGWTSDYYDVGIGVTGGLAPYSVSTSALPDGLELSFDGQEAHITGRPLHAGTTEVTWTIEDAFGDQETTSTTFDFTIQPLWLVTIPPQTWDNSQSAPNTLQLSATGGVAPFTWAATNLPPGLTIDPETGVVTGRPSDSGGRVVTFTVTDSDGRTSTNSTYWLTVYTPLQVAGPATITSVVDQDVTTSYQAWGGSGPYTWALANSVGGVSVGAASGVVHLHATSAIDTHVQLTVTDGWGETTTVDIHVIVVEPDPGAPPPSPGVQINPPSDTTGDFLPYTTGMNVAVPLSAQGGTAPYSWSATGLPTGLSIDASTGELSGRTAIAGIEHATYHLAVTVTDDNALSFTRTITVYVYVPPMWFDVHNQVSERTKPLRMRVRAYGGASGPFQNWRLLHAPVGLDIDDSGNISGTPSIAGTWNVTVLAFDSLGYQSGSVGTFEWTVIQATSETDPCSISGNDDPQCKPSEILDDSITQFENARLAYFGDLPMGSKSKRVIHTGLAPMPHDNGIIVARFFIKDYYAAFGLLLGDNRIFNTDYNMPYRVAVAWDTLTGDVTVTVAPTTMADTNQTVYPARDIGPGKDNDFDVSVQLDPDPIWQDYVTLKVKYSALNSVTPVFSIDGSFSLDAYPEGVITSLQGDAYPNFEVIQYSLYAAPVSRGQSAASGVGLSAIPRYCQRYQVFDNNQVADNVHDGIACPEW
jgi:hypothetical protein